MPDASMAKEGNSDQGPGLMSIRPAAVAGSWYPDSPPSLSAAVDRHLAAADRFGGGVAGDVVALIAPHAGLMYSGPVAAHAYRLLRGRTFDVAVLVGPSHFGGFGGGPLAEEEGFETPFGVARLDAECAASLLDSSIVERRGGV